MENSRRDFVKKVTMGTAGISFGGIGLGVNVLANEPFSIKEADGSTSINIDRRFPPIFPIPRAAEYLDDFFKLTRETTIIMPSRPAEYDKFLSQFLLAELAERYGLVLSIKKTANLTGLTNYILIGSINNPLVKSYASENKIPITIQNPGKEGYFMKVAKSGICILGSDNQGAFYGLQSLRQLIRLHDAKQVQCADIKDWPHMPFRGIRLNIPGPENILFYKRFLRDFMAYFKYNKVIMEMNSVMRFERHPELNAGWIDLFKDMSYSRKEDDSNPGPNGEKGDSVHQDAGDGCILEKQQVADLVKYASQYYIETIPEIPSLSHSSYLLTRHRELAENKNYQWPDTYCPSNPKVYELYFDVLDEYIEVMNPKIINIGHDEWRMPLEECENCKGKDYAELYARDISRIYKYLKYKKIRTAIWGDHLLESVRGKGPQNKKLPSGYTYRIPGGLPSELVVAKIPKDILVLNWFWKSFKGPGEQNTEQIGEWGFEQIYGNFEPYINDFERRSKVKGVLGGASSAWSGTNEFNFGKTKLYKFLGCANLLWSTHYLDEIALARNIQYLVPSIRVNLKGVNPPSKDGDAILPVDLSASFNMSGNDNPCGIPLGLLKNGTVRLNRMIDFELYNPLKGENLCSVVVGSNGKTKTTLPLVSKRISVVQDVSSLIFLHTCAHPSVNIYGHNKIHSYQDTSDLLGWYKVIYEDGFIEVIPVRYGVNIREWHLWGINPQTGKIDECLEEPYCNGVGTYCYEGDILDCSSSQNKELNFFSFEWKNPRFGTKIKEIYLEGSQQFINYNGDVIDSNAIALVALSFVERRETDKVSTQSKMY
ncbi:MAG: beta-N-acetylhexosaminidase [Mangrovibacterium sp.]|nr:beta-N-acetylhexosaminidase [Mangrovibacterium sp.]